MIATPTLTVTWEKLPDDFKLPDDPVDNITQPQLAAALTDSLALADRLPERSLTTTNYAICATVNQKIVVKAPDWCFIPAISVSRDLVERSYTPKLQGDLPVIVMEFLSETAGGEYSVKPTYPPGKWFFYEQILQVPHYVIFDPASDTLELYQLDDAGQYQLAAANEAGRYWLAPLNLYLGIWSGTREKRTGSWLRWWTPEGELLPWAAEKAEQAQQRAEKAEAVQQAAIAKLLTLGLSPEQVASSLGLAVEAVAAETEQAEVESSEGE
ncbi:MAG: Uma2 family endonuclease [Leptolyngbya sp. SIO4C1]|nr:Uma2 family endonuclease [Leptolyngbya sp. SIO4C1]